MSALLLCYRVSPLEQNTELVFERFNFFRYLGGLRKGF